MKVAVILFNLGGPDSLAAVRPFLFNLFNDRAIITIRQPLRWLLAQLISRRRAPVAHKIYGHIGRKSPLLAMTRVQAAALQDRLAEAGEFKTFIAMRYWHPMAPQTAKEVKAYNPDRIILLPLYPQFSTTTTGSSLTDWARAARAIKLTVPSQTICCYPSLPGLIQTIARLTSSSLKQASIKAAPRALFVAHGLPMKIVEAGDPYADHVERTVQSIVDKLGIENLDWVICYQSRVGPRQWLGPSAEDEIGRAARDGKSIVMVPVSFVSEHSETLVELDIEYRKIAGELGVPAYERVPTVTDDPAFMAALKELVVEALKGGTGPAITSGNGARVCAADCPACPLPNYPPNEEQTNV